MGKCCEREAKPIGVYPNVSQHPPERTQQRGREVRTSIPLLMTTRNGRLKSDLERAANEESHNSPAVSRESPQRLKHNYTQQKLTDSKT